MLSYWPVFGCLAMLLVQKLHLVRMVAKLGRNRSSKDKVHRG